MTLRTRHMLPLLSVCLLHACGGDGSTNTSTGPEDTRTRIIPAPYERVTAPRFSPDGQTIAMVGQTTGGDDHIILTDRAGELQRVVLTEGASYLTTFAWSSDGQTLYYSGDGGILSVANQEGATPEVVVDTFAVLGFDISRDDTQIAWSVNGQQNISLGQLMADGTLDEEVPLQVVPGSQPRFSPNGETLLYVRAERFATVPTGSFEESNEVLLDGEASYLSNGAWLGDNEVMLLVDDAIVKKQIDPPMTTELEAQFAATGLDVDASGNYIFHVNGGKTLMLVEQP